MPDRRQQFFHEGSGGQERDDILGEFIRHRAEQAFRIAFFQSRQHQQGAHVGTKIEKIFG
jgi:hypothetical protein